MLDISWISYINFKLNWYNDFGYSIQYVKYNKYKWSWLIEL
jgi:hypothetical protein